MTNLNIGIYFLWLGGECVYVGKSTDIENRICKHRGRFEFDKHTVMSCEAWELDAFEARFIHALKPKHNSVSPKIKSLPNLVPVMGRPMHARTATLDELLENLIPNWITPPPKRDTLRNWLDTANIPRFKTNPLAKRGGGPVFYSVSAVEQLFKNNALPGKINGHH